MIHLTLKIGKIYYRVRGTWWRSDDDR